jgi:putative hemolysin
MDDSVIIELLAIFVLVLANGFFALSEFSIIASRRGRLQQKIKNRKPGARAAMALRENPEKFLATVQVGITMVGTIAGVFGGATLVDRLSVLLKEVPYEIISNSSTGIAVALIAIGITIGAVVIGELVPKYVALSNPERFARMVARPITLFIRLTSFFSMILAATAGFIVKALGIKRDSETDHVGEEEINQLIFEGAQKGVFDATEERMIRSVFEFGDTNVRRAMTPRTDVIGLSIDATSAQVLQTIVEEGYSRYPVYEGDLDKIIGFLYTKDIIHHKLNPDLITLKDIIRPPIFVPDSMPLNDLLSEIQRKKFHIAIVLDEFGGTAGIITLEDVIEELVGEIQDEYDEEKSPLVRHSETVAFADGTVWPGDINTLMETKLPEDDADTLAGLVIHHLGRLPDEDDDIVIDGVRITILEQEENRLTRLKIEKIHIQVEGDD